MFSGVEVRFFVFIVTGMVGLGFRQSSVHIFSLHSQINCLSGSRFIRRRTIGRGNFYVIQSCFGEGNHRKIFLYSGNSCISIFARVRSC